MNNLEQALEAILFVASEPIALGRLVEATQHPQADVELALDQLGHSLEDTGLTPHKP